MDLNNAPVPFDTIVRPLYLAQPQWSGWEEIGNVYIGYFSGPHVKVPCVMSHADVAHQDSQQQLNALLRSMYRNGINAYYDMAREDYKKRTYGS